MEAFSGRGVPSGETVSKSRAQAVRMGYNRYAAAASATVELEVTE